MRLRAVLLLALLAHSSAADESCVGRCNKSFEDDKKCQCDSLCKYCKNCCSDYDIVCDNTNNDELLPDGTTLSPLTAISQPRSTQRSSPDFSRRGLQHPDTTLEMTKPLDWMDTIFQKIPSQTVPLMLDGRCVSAKKKSCTGRCGDFSRDWICQCDLTCGHYKNCCPDYQVICGKTNDEDELFEGTTTSTLTAVGHQMKPTLKMTKPPEQEDTLSQKIPVMQMTPSSQTVPPSQDIPLETATAETTTAPSTTGGTTEAPDPDAVVCSGRPFDSFMELKNGSIYAFRGDYVFVLEQKTVLPGYPKLIKDVWGINGPIDAAFSRVNCLGKTYIFKGNKYWRFDDGVVDDDYPRDISVGFDKIPDHVDAAFALPASGDNGREKAYFFKGDQYYVYEFLHRPSRDECISKSETSPSTLSRRYTDVYYDNYERLFSQLFSGMPQHHDKHHFIEKDWKGLKSPLDAVMAGRMYVPPRRSTQRRNNYRYDQQRNQQYAQQWGHRRQRRSPLWESMAEQGMNMGQQFAERGMEMGLRLAEKRMEMGERFGRDWERQWDQDWDQDRRRDGYSPNNRGNYDYRSYQEPVQRDLPIQTAYFFRGEESYQIDFKTCDKYYRVDLRTRRVDAASPPYPRSIGKYWLGCSDTTRAEK